MMVFSSKPKLNDPSQNQVSHDLEIHFPDQIFEKIKSHITEPNIKNVTKTFITHKLYPDATKAIRNGKMPTKTTSHQNKNVRASHFGG
jgi:hypothetical protein